MRKIMNVNEIVAGAAVTIATNMAGRGTDIKLGEGVEELGGLADRYIVTCNLSY